MSEAEDFYSVDEASRILKLTPGRIRQMLRAGEIDPLTGVPKRKGQDLRRRAS